MSEPAARTAVQTPSQRTLKVRASQAYSHQLRESQEEKWILDYLPLVRHVVHKVVAHLGRKVDMEDLISSGTLGLVKAARAFDPSRDVEFKTYAYIRIRGAVIDELRGNCFVPYAAVHQIRLVQQAYQRLVGVSGQPPADEELAAEAGISLAQLYRTLEEVRRQHFLSIHGLSDEPSGLDPFVPADRGPSPLAEAERKEMLVKMAKAISGLEERDRITLLLYYERDLTMKEAAAVLGVTESRFSQLHASALFKLAMKLRSQP